MGVGCSSRDDLITWGVHPPSSVPHLLWVCVYFRTWTGPHTEISAPAAGCRRCTGRSVGGWVSGGRSFGWFNGRWFDWVSFIRLPLCPSLAVVCVHFYMAQDHTPKFRRLRRAANQEDAQAGRLVGWWVVGGWMGWWGVLLVGWAISVVGCVVAWVSGWLVGWSVGGGWVGRKVVMV